MRYIEVFWSPYYNKLTSSEFENNILFSKPKPFFPMLMEARNGMPYLKCPAVSKEYQNDFVICAPYDLKYTFDSNLKTISTDRFGQTFYDTMLNTSWHNLPEGLPPLVQSTPRYIIYSFEDVEIEQTDLPILNSKFSSNTKVIRGTYNISKWYRPIEVAFEVIDVTKPVVMEAGEPMCLLRFKTPNNVPIKLTRVDITPELEERILSCLSVKSKRSGLKLEKLYDLAADYIEVFKRKNK